MKEVVIVALDVLALLVGAVGLALFTIPLLGVGLGLVSAALLVAVVSAVWGRRSGAR